MGSRAEARQWHSSTGSDHDRSREHRSRPLDDRKPSPRVDRSTEKEHRRQDRREETYPARSHSNSPSCNRNRGRRRKNRSTYDDYSGDDRRKRRRRRRSPESRSPGRSYSRGRDRSSDRRHRRKEYDDSPAHYRRRRRSSPADNRRRRSRRRRRRNRRRRSDSSGSSRPPPVADDVAPRAGVVSVGSEEGGNQAPPAEPRKPAPQAVKKRASGSSGRDDAIGHFQGKKNSMVGNRYRILKEVGVGTFGRVVECLDMKRLRSSRRDRQEHKVAIKIVRNVKRYYESALIEAEIVEDVNRRGGRGLSHCAVMYHAFSFAGHYCMVFERLGPSLYDFLKRQKYQPFPISCCRDFAKQLLETLEFLHGLKLIHTDLKPENILLLNGREISHKGYNIPECTRIKVIDFGGATYDSEKKSSVVNTRQYRAPEVILNLGWSMPSDMWSVGCILAELYQGELLFATHDNVEHLALIEQVIGPFPRHMLKRSKNVQLTNEAFDSSGAHRMERVLPPESLAYVKRIGPLDSLVYEEDAWFLRLLRKILVTDPDERATARECLRKF